MNIKGSKEYKCRRICTMYVETGRTITSLAKYYDTSKSTIGRYILDYAAECLDYNLYKQVRQRVKSNLQETGLFGRSLNYYSDEVGSLE